MGCTRRISSRVSALPFIRYVGALSRKRAADVLKALDIRTGKMESCMQEIVCNKYFAGRKLVSPLSW